MNCAACAGTEWTDRPGHGQAHRTKLVRQQIGAHSLGIGNIWRDKTVARDHMNCILSPMLSKCFCRQHPKLDAAFANHVLPLV